MGKDERGIVLSSGKKDRTLQNGKAEIHGLAVFHELLEQPQDLLGDWWYSTSCKAAKILCSGCRRTLRFIILVGNMSSAIDNFMNQIHGLETAQEILTAYLETGKGSDTILNKLQQNETTLKTLQQQLAYKKTEIPTVDEDTYRKLVKQFKHYMSHVKSPEAAALKLLQFKTSKFRKRILL